MAEAKSEDDGRLYTKKADVSADPATLQADKKTSKQFEYDETLVCAHARGKLGWKTSFWNCSLEKIWKRKRSTVSVNVWCQNFGALSATNKIFAQSCPHK